jgi:glycosyltransferase involved in cell wall biosynthesis
VRLAVVSYKICWRSDDSPSGFATDGGFPFQMKAISELFDETRLVVPVAPVRRGVGEVALSGHNLSLVPVDVPVGQDLRRKLGLPQWLVRNLATIIREIRNADAVHTPIPGDLGSIGMLVAMALRKPLFIRYCGNWQVRKTLAERLWGWLLERKADARTVVLATGGGPIPPSYRNSNLRWIFASSLTQSELARYATVRHAPSPDGPKLVIACRQERKKGTGQIIESLPLLAKSYPNISLDVIGEGVHLPEFRKTAERCNVAQRVRFHGKVDHAGVMEILSRSDLFCFPTRASEGFPKAVLEALACGLPVVSTRVSVLGDLLSAGGGVLLDESSPEAIAAGVNRCLESDAHYRKLSADAIRIASAYSLEVWRDTIGAHLTSGWGALRARDG